MRTRAGIPEFFEVHFRSIAARQFQSLIILITRQHGPVVLENKIVDTARQAILMRQVHPVVHMADYGGCRLFGRDIGMCVYITRGLILDEEGRINRRLADIMESRADARQQRIGPDLLSRPLGQVGNLQAVLIGAGRRTQEHLQERKIGARDLEQLQGSGQTEELRQHILQ